MMMTTVVAVALGLAPVNDNGTSQTVDGDFSTAVGRYSQTVDSHGVTHLSGFNRFNGAPYEITVDQDGFVKGSVGDAYVTFRVSEPS
jgi:hypothetical protein